MLKPAMNELMKRVGNRYLLVNLTAQRARDIADDAQQTGDILSEKVVKMALDEIAAGTIVYRPGKKEDETEKQDSFSAVTTLDLDLDFDDELLETDEEEHEVE